MSVMLHQSSQTDAQTHTLHSPTHLALISREVVVQRAARHSKVSLMFPRKVTLAERERKINKD